MAGREHPIGAAADQPVAGTLICGLICHRAQRNDAPTLRDADLPGARRHRQCSTSHLATSSSTLLGGCALLAGGTVAEVADQDALQCVQDCVETQVVPDAFG